MTYDSDTCYKQLFMFPLPVKQAGGKKKKNEKKSLKKDFFFFCCKDDTRRINALVGPSPFSPLLTPKSVGYKKNQRNRFDIFTQREAARRSIHSTIHRERERDSRCKTSSLSEKNLTHRNQTKGM